MVHVIAIGALVCVLIALPLTIFRPAWVFYLFLFTATFGSLMAGNIHLAGNLGLPRAWQPADMLWLLTLFAALLVPRHPAIPRDPLRQSLILVAIVCSISLILGLVLHFNTALTRSREMYGIPAMLFALRYLTTTQRIRNFFRFSVFLLMVMFGVHLLIRFGLYAAPYLGEDVTAGQWETERGEATTVPMLYLVLVSIGVGKLATRARPVWVAPFYMLIGAIGVALSETRTLIGALAVIGGVSLVFVPRRGLVVIAYTASLLLTVYLTQLAGFDVLSRFRTRFGRGVVQVQVSDLSYRTLEYGALAEAYKQEPFNIILGRGVGAGHYIPTVRMGQIVYWHSEYLTWLDRCGLVGLVSLLVMSFFGLRQSYRWAKSGIPDLSYYGVIVTTLLSALVLTGFINPTFLRIQAPHLLCYLAVIANAPLVRENLLSSREAWASP